MLYFLPFFGLKNNFAQNLGKITGKILDARSKKPLAGADVFFANTSLGTATDSEGIFLIKNISQNAVDLVVSFVGYQTIMMPLRLDTLGRRSLTILLQEKSDEMQEVTVTAQKGEAWYKNFEIFKANFLGTDDYAKYCTIKNKDELHFTIKDKIFSAWADETLLIENKALGYTLKYQLKDFMLDYTQGYFMIVGYPFFEKMKGTKKQEKTWQKNRLKAYQGSIMHLIRSLYAQNWQEEGFECRRLIRHPNKNRPSDSLINKKIKQFMPKNTKNNQIVISPNDPKKTVKFSTNGNTTITEFPTKTLLQDSLDYWIEKKKMPKTVQYLENKLLTPADSIVIVYAKDTTLRKINLKSCLQVVYKPKKQQVDKLNGLVGGTALLTFNKPIIYLQRDGYVIENLDITYEGYITEKKIANLLPLDYDPEKDF